MDFESSDRETKSPEKFKSVPRVPRDYEDDPDAKSSKKARKIKGSFLASCKPSYCLKRGIGGLQCCGENLRVQHRKRLRWLVERLIRRCSWEEVGGVLSVLLQGSGREYSPSHNRAKYRAALDLLNHIKDGNISSRRIRNIYDLWIKKIGRLKNWSEKNRFAVQVEFIIFCLQHRSKEDAYQAALCLMQENGFSDDPVSNFVVGLVFYELWYSSIPKELKLTELDSSSTFQQWEPVGGVYTSMSNSVENVARVSGEVKSPLNGVSNSSIANDKEVFVDDINLHEEPMEINDDLGKETSFHGFQTQQFYLNSAEEIGQMDHAFPNYSDDFPHASIFHTQGLPPWLLPLKMPSFDENLEDVVDMLKRLRNDSYKNAVKHLRVAFHSKPSLYEAFHPLIQILLLGDQVNEAIGELENLHHSTTIVQLRLKAGLLEHFDRENYFKLCTSFEDILKKDPTCSTSLSKLVLMHHRGEYGVLDLVEMIALHLDAAFGTSEIWKELATCFLKLSQCEEDRVSILGDGIEENAQEFMSISNKIPEIFTNNESGKSWSFRFRWWLRRYFHKNILKSDISSGDVQLLTCKAAAAGHIYGRHFKYVEKAIEVVEKQNDMEMYSILQTHVLNSVGFFVVRTSDS